MRAKNIKPFTYGSLYKQDLPDGKNIPLAAGNLIDFGTFIADIYTPRGRLPQYNRAGLTIFT